MIDNLLYNFSDSFQGSVLRIVRPAVHRDIELFRIFQVHVLVVGTPLADRHAEAYQTAQDGLRLGRVFACIPVRTRIHGVNFSGTIGEVERINIFLALFPFK